MIDILIKVEEAIFEYRRIFGYKGSEIDDYRCRDGVKYFHDGRCIFTLNLYKGGKYRLDKHYLGFRRGE